MRTDYEVTVRRDVRIPTREDGVTLSGDLFLPVGAGRVPLLLTVLPYRRDLTALTGSPTERWFAARGYASLLVDLRGTGSSDGTARPPFDPAEVDDALAAIDWAVAQSWSDGAVGMWGGSYGAMMTLRTALRRPPALRAIIAMEGLTDPERDFVHPGGSRGALAPLGAWALTTLLGQLLPPVDDYADPAEQARWRRRLAAEPYLLDLFRRGPGDPAWAARRFDTSGIEVPALCLAGWRDLFVEPAIRSYEQISGPKRLVAGPWMHTMPQDCPHTPIDLLELALDWWERWLRDVPNGREDAPPVSVHVQGERPRWLGFSSWPPRGTSWDLDVSSWPRTAPAAPDPAVGVLSGLWAVPVGLFGRPLDQHDDDARSVCHTSPPLDEPLLISGRPRVALDRPWPRVSVKLTDVDSAGRSTLICAGLASTAEGTGAVEVALTPTTYEIPAGHRLRVAVAPGDFPRVWPAHPAGDASPAVTALSLPLAAVAFADDVEYPAPRQVGPAEAAVPADAAAPPVWEITHGLLDDTVSVRIAGSGVVRPDARVDRKHQISIEQELVATAHRAAPDRSAITGRVAATVDTETGEHITVDVALTATASAIDATGRVTRDGETLLDQRWRGRAARERAEK